MAGRGAGAGGRRVGRHDPLLPEAPAAPAAPPRGPRRLGTGPSTSSGWRASATCSRRGLTLALIGRLVRGELDATDEPLAAAVLAADAEDAEEFLSLDELAGALRHPDRAARSGRARRAARRPATTTASARYTAGDVAVVAAGMRLLETGLPLAELLALARAHHAATRAIAAAGGRDVRRARAPAAARRADRPTTRRRTASSTRSGAAPVGDHARRAPLPPRAARGRAGAPRGGRRREPRSRPPAPRRADASRASGRG